MRRLVRDRRGDQRELIAVMTSRTGILVGGRYGVTLEASLSGDIASTRQGFVGDRLDLRSRRATPLGHVRAATSTNYGATQRDTTRPRNGQINGSRSEGHRQQGMLDR